MDLRLAGAGLLVGTVAGMSGIGGSALLAPILIGVFGMNATVAVGTDLVYSVPMKALAAYAHVRQGTVNGRIVRLLAFGGVPGAIVGLIAFVVVRAHVAAPAFEGALRHAIGVVILISATFALFVHLVAPRAKRAPGVQRDGPVIAIGTIVGVLVALTSIGSGSITLPLLMLALPVIGLRSLIGSEIVFAAIMVPVAASGHMALANVDWPTALTLMLGALPGAYLGARLCTRVGEQILRPFVVMVLAFAGFELL